VEVALRVQRLREVPELKTIMRALPDDTVAVGPGVLERSGPGVEVDYDHSLVPMSVAVEVAYDGGIPLDETVLEDPAQLTGAFGDLGGWIAATLVRLGDLQLDFLPADELEE
jgi:hypothetical protein